MPLSQFCVKRAHQISAAWLRSAVCITSSKQLCICMCAGNCNGDSECRDDFYSDPVAVGYYKDHVRRILNRVNTFNGRLYRQVFRLKTWPICETGDEGLGLSCILCLQETLAIQVILCRYIRTPLLGFWRSQSGQDMVCTTQKGSVHWLSRFNLA